MNTDTNAFTAKVNLLKESRLQLLQLHKMLVDIERENYEKENGQVSSGQFLNLLIGEPSFGWLRKFSTLIVNIDEMLDLDDGFHEGFVDKHFESMRNLLSMGLDDVDFNSRFKDALANHAEVSTKKEGIESLLNE